MYKKYVSVNCRFLILIFMQPDDPDYDKNVEEMLECTSSNLAYMVDLLQVQYMRGCTNGERFTLLLKSKLQQETASTSMKQVCHLFDQVAFLITASASLLNFTSIKKYRFTKSQRKILPVLNLYL